MIIFGVAGGIGHGKSSLAAAFAQAEPRTVQLESFELIAEVINEWQARAISPPDPQKLAEVNHWISLLPAVLEQIIHRHVDARALRFSSETIATQPALYEKLFSYLQAVQANPTLFQTPITSVDKAQYRSILQWLGGYGAITIDRGIWYDELMRRAQVVAAQGMRLCVISGVCFVADAEIVRADGGYIVLVERPLVGQQDANDPTERERSRIRPDTTVVNDAGLAELEVCARRIYADGKRKKLQTRYAASTLYKSPASSS